MTTKNDWATPSALAIPKEGYFKLEQGKYGPIFPRTPACHGFSVIGTVKPGTAGVIRAYGKTIEQAVAADPSVLAPLRLHYRAGCSSTMIRASCTRKSSTRISTPILRTRLQYSSARA